MYQHPLFVALHSYFAIKFSFLNVHFAYFSTTFRCLLQKCQVLMQSDSPHDIITYAVSLFLAVSNFGSRISGNFMGFFLFYFIFCFVLPIISFTQVLSDELKHLNLMIWNLSYFNKGHRHLSIFVHEKERRNKILLMKKIDFWKDIIDCMEG